MNRFAIIAAVLCFALTTLAAGVCTDPSTTTITNQPALDNSTVTATTGTGIISNTVTLSPGINETRLLQVVVVWDLVVGRTVTGVSIGPNAGDCNTFIVQSQKDVDNWKVTHDTDACKSYLFAQYKWPAALYDSSCKARFVETYGPTAYNLDFDVYVSFTDTVSITRAGETTQVTQSSAVIVPVILSYPLTVNVSMSDLRVFAQNSIDIDVTLTAQTIQNASPYSVKFDSYISRSFAIAIDSITYYNGSQAPTSKSVVAVPGGDTFVATVTRVQHWDIHIMPGSQKCQFDGYYLINVTVYWTGEDENGATLPPSDNPIPGNTTAYFGFNLDSQNFCGTTISNTLSAVMKTFIDPPAATGGHTNNEEHTGFLQNDKVYFRAVVTSLNLPIKTTVLTYLESVQGANTAEVLVENGVQQFTELALANSSISDKPNNETDWELVVHEVVFPVNQDRSLTYTFNAILTVTYQTGLKRDITLRQSSAGTESSTKATANINLQRALSSAASLSASVTLAMLSMLVGLYILY